MKVVIHSCQERHWYVERHLMPSIMGQGVPMVSEWLDDRMVGNLESFMDCLSHVGVSDGDTWHIQDDVVVHRKFAELAVGLEGYDGIVCGFCSDSDASKGATGEVPTSDMWYSFPCIRIPNRLARDVSEWFFREAKWDDRYSSFVSQRKGDDTLFRDYVLGNYGGGVTNLVPNLVEHIDHMIGGSVVNPGRRGRMTSAYFDDTESVDRLREVLDGYKRNDVRLRPDGRAVRPS